jgi:arylformamidase
MVVVLADQKPNLLAAAVKAAGKPVRLLVGEHYNHFELPETLGNPYGLLGRAVLELMGLTGETSR